MDRWWVAAAAVVFLAGCAGRAETGDGGAGEAVQDAGWQAGYWYEYESTFAMTGHMDVQSGGFSMSEDLDEPEETSTYTLEVLSTQVPDGKTPMYLAWFEDGYWEEAYLAGYRQSDLTEFEAEAIESAGRSTGIAYREVGDYPFLDFPLEDGKTWDGVLEDEEMAPGAVRIESRVEGAETVDGPDGKVEAVRVTHAITGDANSMEAMMRESLEEEDMEVTDLQVEFTGTAVLHFAPALHNTVLAEFAMHMMVHLEGESDGTRATMDIEMDMEGTDRMTDYSLEATDDPGLAGVLDWLNGGAGGGLDGGGGLGGGLGGGIGGGAGGDGDDGGAGDGGEAPRPVLSLTSGKALANSANAEAVSFGLVLQNAPPNARVAFTITGHGDSLEGEGVVALAGPGPSGTFSHSFDRPGLYVVEAWLLDHSGAVQDALVLPVEHRADVALDCPPVAAVAASPCAEVAIPVDPGCASVTVTLAAEGAALPAGELWLEAPDGALHKSPVENGAATVTAPVEEGEDQDWTALYVPTAHVLPEGTLSVLVEPLGAPSPQAGPGQAGGLAATATGLGQALARFGTEAMAGMAGLRQA